MKNIKAVILVVLSVVLVAALVYLTLLIQDGSNPIGMFGIRASNPEDEVDPFLAENPVPTEEVQPEEIPTPTEVLVAYNSTSPTLAPGAGTGAPETTEIPTPTLTEAAGTTNVYNFSLINTGGEESTPSATPTTIQSLPVSGFADNLNAFLIGGGILILLGLLL